MVTIEELREAVSSTSEWLLIREVGRAFPILAREIEFRDRNGRRHFGFLADDGFHLWSLDEASLAGPEISLKVTGAFGRRHEVVRLVPRSPAAELAAEVMRARLESANELAALIKQNLPGVKIKRVSLNTDNGRLAQIEVESEDKTPAAALSDITATLTSESIFTSAISWLDKLASRRKKPVRELLLLCEKRQARNAQKLHTMLTAFWKERLTIHQIDRRSEPPSLVEFPKRRVSDLWRGKAPKLLMPASAGAGGLAERIYELAPDEIDEIYSRQGTTLRFNGLPFVRVRSMLGEERGWFGTGRDRRALLPENWADLERLVETLREHRSANASNKRHEYYRSSAEAWLESILRRDIRLLDANLILSPIYNQFRSSNDKIDLLAMRRDGRLVIIELKTQPDRAGVFQAADYWRKIELQRRRGILAAADLFGGREIADRPALVYIAAPAWSFHRDFEFFARSLAPEIELWRFELHEDWRSQVRVVARENY